MSAATSGIVAVQAAVGGAPVARLGDGGGHQRQLGSGEAAPPVVELGRDRGDGRHDLGAVAVRGAHEQRVQPVLGGQLAGDGAAAAGEGGDAPLGGVRGVLGVPGLVGAEEVAGPEVGDPDRGGGAAVAARSSRRDGCGSRSQLERHLRVDGHEVVRRRQRLVLVEAVRGDQLGEVAAVEPAGHVVAGRDGAERAGVVDEARGAAEPGGLGDGAAVAADRLRGVEEPPGRTRVDARVEARPAARSPGRTRSRRG